MAFPSVQTSNQREFSGRTAQDTISSFFGGAQNFGSGSARGGGGNISAIPVWVWLAAAGAAIVGLVMVLKKKK